MSEDLSKCRRNLLIACSVIIIFWLAGAEIKSISVPGMAVTLSRPEILVYFLWIAMLYELIRFRNLYKDSSPKHALATEKYIANNEKILIYIKGCDPQFIEVQKDYPSIIRGIFKRKIAYIANNEGYQEERFVNISLVKIFALEISAYLKYAVSDLQFIEYDLPILWAVVAIALPVGEMYIAFLR